MLSRGAIAVLTFCMLMSAAIAAQTTKLEGIWEGKMDHEGSIETLTFEFHVKGAALTGNVQRNGGDFGDISNAKMDGDKFSFQAGGISFAGVLEGKLVKITVTVFNGNKFYVSASRKK